MFLTVDLLNLEHDWKKNGRKMNKSFVKWTKWHEKSVIWPKIDRIFRSFDRKKSLRFI